MRRLHYALIRGCIDRGHFPDTGELARQLNVAEAEVRDLLLALSDVHGVVLHPHAVEPWIVHPFSSTPTLHWIKNDERGWWAPCMWCAFGVATLIGGHLRISTRFGAEAETSSIDVHDGNPIDQDEVVVHFAIPPARAWDNVHSHCSMVLPFRSVAAIRPWCIRHGLPEGEAVPIEQVALLARNWYGRHADPDWRKWTIAEAQQIFHQAGLTSKFWDLEPRAGNF